MSNLPVEDGHTHPCQVPKRGYLQWMHYADQMNRQKVRQALCVTCERWKFPDERCDEFEEKTDNVESPD